MVDSQEIVERSIYVAILNTTVKLGYTLDPNDYLPITQENAKRFDEDRKAIIKEKGFYIPIFGVGNNQSRGIKETPRITIESEGFYPGDIGLPKYILDKEDNNWVNTEFPTEALSQFINIRLCATTSDHMRLLHRIMFWSIPQRGYLKPYEEDKFLFTGNIFLQVINFYNHPDLDEGLQEKVYQFEVSDCLIESNKLPEVITPIKDISVLLENINYTLTVPGVTPPTTSKYLLTSKREKILTSDNYTLTVR